MQQALLGRGSNRKTAAGGLKEVVLERCACAPQNMEEGGGSQDGNTVSRKGGGRFAPPQSASARGPLNGERAAREAKEVRAACRGDVQRRNKSSQNGGSCISHRCPGVVQAVREAATDSEMDGHGTEARKYPQAGVQSSSSGSYGPGQEFDVAAGGLYTSGSQKRELEDDDEEEMDRAGRSFAAAWTAEARQSSTDAGVQAQQMTMASAAVSAMVAMLLANGAAQNQAGRAQLHKADQAIAAMASASRSAAASAARSSADAGRKATELAETVSAALRVIAIETESIAHEVKSAVAIAAARSKRQKASATRPWVGADEQEPEWLRVAGAELMATATGYGAQGNGRHESRLLEAAAAQSFAAYTLQRAWRRRVRRRVVEAAEAAAAADFALACRQREARARLDAREAEDAAKRRALGRKHPSGSGRRTRQRRMAAVHIQAAWRGFLGRDAARQQRGHSVQAALCVQAVQTRLLLAQRRNSAAIRIQAVWHGFRTRGNRAPWWPLLLAMGDAGRPRRSGGRQRRAARLTHQRAALQQESAAYDWAVVQRARAEMAVVMGEDWEERAQTNLERSRLRYADGLSRLASELAPPRRKRLEYATWS
jgi:hypothetical protein